mgnify:CR=1 FL=1
MDAWWWSSTEQHIILEKQMRISARFASPVVPPINSLSSQTINPVLVVPIFSFCFVFTNALFLACFSVFLPTASSTICSAGSFLAQKEQIIWECIGLFCNLLFLSHNLFLFFFLAACFHPSQIFYVHLRTNHACTETYNTAHSFHR